MDDLISRQAALDAINSGMLTDDDTQFECPSECNSMLEWAVNAVKELPTAEPSVVTMKLNADPEEVKKLINRSMTLMPTAEKRSRWTGRVLTAEKKGKWTMGENMPPMKHRNGKPKKFWPSLKYCSCCGHEAFDDSDWGEQLFDWCPYCGARMEE